MIQMRATEQHFPMVLFVIQKFTKTAFFPFPANKWMFQGVNGLIQAKIVTILKSSLA